MATLTVLSHIQVNALFAARERGQSLVTESLDLGLTKVEIELSVNYVLLPDNQRLDWAQLREIVDNKLSCYLVRDSQIEKIHFFWYARRIGGLALIGYAAGALVYIVQYRLTHG